jgi:hypothetical protein
LGRLCIEHQTSPAQASFAKSLLENSAVATPPLQGWILRMTPAGLLENLSRHDNEEHPYGHDHWPEVGRIADHVKQREDLSRPYTSQIIAQGHRILEHSSSPVWKKLTILHNWQPNQNWFCRLTVGRLRDDEIVAGPSLSVTLRKAVDFRISSGAIVVPFW